jgi:hypothetical protein
MGASKRLAELIVQRQAVGSGTSFSVVRFGNVLGSNGSAVPRFIEQIRKGGPVTVTHPEMRRFFMLIPEAVQLVLHAASQAASGVTYVLEMGDQIKLVDLARDLIRLSGLVPDEDIKIEFTGVRPGEKMSEELAGPDEEVAPSTVEKILCVRSRRQSRRSRGRPPEGTAGSCWRRSRTCSTPAPLPERPAALRRPGSRARPRQWSAWRIRVNCVRGARPAACAARVPGLCPSVSARSSLPSGRFAASSAHGEAGCCRSSSCRACRSIRPPRRI